MDSLLPVQYVKFVTKRCFGVEIEVNRKLSVQQLAKIVQEADPKRQVMSTQSYQQDYSNDYWHVKFDRSCGDRSQEGGWEIASYKASGAKDLLKIEKVMKAVSENGAEVNNNCGFHIHVEIADFNTIQAATLVAYWLKIEKMICEILPKHRRNNMYAKLLTDKFHLNTSVGAYNPTSLWMAIRPPSFDHEHRRVSLNITNYALQSHNRRTVELRLPEGTVNPKEIKNWVRLFLHFVDSCKKRDFPESLSTVTDLRECATILGLHNDNPFFILSKGLYETKTWFLRRASKLAASKKVQNEANQYLNFILVDSPKKATREVVNLKEVTKNTGEL
jgi:Putative amidoligase enzyme